MTTTSAPWFKLLRAACGCAVALGAMFTVLELARAAPPKRARAPRFSKSIEDAFFSDALAKLVGARPARAVADEPASPKPPAQGASAPPGSAGPSAWSKLILAEVIEDEIKAQQIQLAESVASAVKFKGGGYQRARVQLSLLAVLFAIDAEYGEPMRWQREAAALRDLTARAGFNCKVGTDASYKEAKERAEELQGLVRGGSVQLPIASAESTWPKIADRTQLMKRLEQAQQQVLAPATANASAFARGGDKLAHEAQLVAALSAVIADAGYENADDETYREFAHAMQNSALAVRDSVGQQNYDEARRAVGEVSKSCTHCHEGFRN